MEFAKIWAGKAMFIILAMALLLQGTAVAEMSERELRLKALEERYEGLNEKVSFLDRFSFKGDFRLRHQSDFFDEDNQTGNVPATDNRHRQRIRLRLGGKFHINKHLDVGFRLASGGTDPVSTNETLDDFFSTKDLRLDRAFASYEQGPIALAGGKFSTPFMHSELVFDSDLSMEGASEKFTHKMGKTKMELILGQFILDEFSGGASDEPNLFAYQGVVSRKFGDAKAKIGVAYYDYNAIRAQDDFLTDASLEGNTADANGNPAFNFDLVDVIGEVGFDLGIPVKVFGEYVQNTADDVRKDTGWQVGLKLNKKVKKFGDWQFKYLYREVEADAVLGFFTDSDFHGGGTNAKGSEINLKLGLMKGAYASVTYFLTEVESGLREDHDILQADLIFKF